MYYYPYIYLLFIINNYKQLCARKNNNNAHNKTHKSETAVCLYFMLMNLPAVAFSSTVIYQSGGGRHDAVYTKNSN